MAIYIVSEIQSNGTTASVITNTYTDRNDAENKWHTILAYAAKSNTKIHSATMMTDDGYFIKSEHYEHEGEAE